jgi:hypothetical protein
LYPRYDLYFTLIPRATVKEGIVNVKELVYAAPSDESHVVASNYSATQDIFDLNGNNNYSEYITTYSTSALLNIIATENIFLNGCVGLPGKVCKSYDPDDSDPFVVPLTTGVKADYALNLNSTFTSAGGGFVAYVPVPHTNMNYGADFQPKPFEWNMALDGPPSFIPPRYSIEYTTDAITSSAQAEEADYVTADQISDWSKVTMIKVYNSSPLTPGEQESIVFSYVAADDNASTYPAKINIF